MLFNQPLVSTMEPRMLLAQRDQPLLQHLCLSVHARPVPRTCEPAREEQQHCQDEAQRHTASHYPALVDYKCRTEEGELLALGVLDDQHT